MKQFTKAGLALLAALCLAACGGGGGGGDEGDSTSGPRAALPTLQQDIEPGGATTDVQALNYYGVPDGRSVGYAADHWDYEQTLSGAAAGTVVRRMMVSSTPGFLVVSEEDSRNGTSVSQQYQRTAAGLVNAELLGAGDGVPVEIASAVDAWLELPEQLPAFGSTRGLLRQGPLGDLDGDGHADSFRLDVRQTVVGLETVGLRNATQAEALHLRLVVTMELVPSDRKQSSYRVESTEDQWWVAGVGLVRSTATATDSQGVVLVAQTLELTGGELNGTPLLAPQPDGSLRTVELPHNALVYDPTRNVYYASVPGSVTGRGNTLARIDPATGAVTHSGYIGSEPTALALSADGSTLYVGLDGSSEVARVRLPDMVVEATVRLPAPSLYASAGRVREMAVSPVDPGLVAILVTDYYDNPLLLWRGGSLATASGNTFWQRSGLAFSADGGQLFQLGSELRRFALSGTDLVEQAWVYTPELSGQRLVRTPQGLVAGNAVFSTTDLQRLGTVPTGSACMPATATGRLLCVGSVDGEQAVLVVDATTLAVVAQPRWRRHGDGRSDWASQLVPGPVGQVALRNLSYSGAVPASLTLFTSDALP